VEVQSGVQVGWFLTWLITNEVARSKYIYGTGLCWNLCKRDQLIETKGARFSLHPLAEQKEAPRLTRREAWDEFFVIL
jgi:hypothetical protein